MTVSQEGFTMVPWVRGAVVGSNEEVNLGSVTLESPAVPFS